MNSQSSVQSQSKKQIILPKATQKYHPQHPYNFKDIPFQQLNKKTFRPQYQSVDFQRHPSKKNLQIYTNIDDEYKIKRDSGQVEQQDTETHKQAKTSRKTKQKLQSILSNCDKDYGLFQESIDKLKNSISNKENISQIRSVKGLHSHQSSLYQKLESPKFKKACQIQTGTVGSPRIMKLLDSKETSKRSSCQNSQSEFPKFPNLTIFQNIGSTTNSITDMKSIQAIRDYSQKIIYDSQIQTEKRGEQKVVIKLKNDIQLLNELLDDEKLRNEEIEEDHKQLVKRMEEEFTKDKWRMEKKIGELESKVKDLEREVVDTQKFYEDLIKELKQQIHFMQQSQKRQIKNMAGISKIECIQNNQSSIFLNDTIKELGFELSPQKQNESKQNKLKGLISNMSNQVNSSQKPQFLEGYSSPSFRQADQSHNSTHNSILVTSDLQQQTNVSATISQLDNFNNNVKLIKHFNRVPKGDIDPLKYNKGHQSSMIEYDDSIICEEAEINVNQIKSSNFHLKRNPQNDSQLQDQSNLEFQIHSLINQIEQFINIKTYSGYLLNQTQELSPSKRFKMSRQIGSGRSSLQMNNLQTFGGVQAQSLTGTQQLNQGWNEMAYSSRAASTIMKIAAAQEVRGDQSSDFDESMYSQQIHFGVENRQIFEESLKNLRTKLQFLVNK